MELFTTFKVLSVYWTTSLLLCVEATLDDERTIHALTEALINPTAAVEAYPSVREARGNGLGSLTEALGRMGGSGNGNGGGNGLFSSLLGGVSQAFSSFSTMFPSLSPKSLQNMERGKAAADGPAGFHPPRTSKPGPEVFKKWADRKAHLKGRPRRQVESVEVLLDSSFRQKRQAMSVSSLKKAGLLRTPGQQGSPLGGSGFLGTLLSAISSFFGGMGSMSKTPVTRMKSKMHNYEKSASSVVNRVRKIPNKVFGTIRSRRETDLDEVPATNVDYNVVDVGLTETAVAHQKLWFNYLDLYNSTNVACLEWEYCRTALENNQYKSALAINGGKFLSYLTAGLQESRGNHGGRLTEAVDCCLSESEVQADSCSRFYRERCLQAHHL